MKHSEHTASELRFMRVREVMEKTGLSKSSIYDLVARGKMPQKVRLGRQVAFVETEIMAWMAERVAARNTAE
ncbi:helix-turn-helix transcriptional regulator [Aeromonas enteropelogenes]|uniref:helix-turn-helix transcriptional regulator n=1 Tax=Aeromonas enteropelogenes TaxID=29489 RepID=UPI003B9EFD0F